MVLEDVEDKDEVNVVVGELEVLGGFIPGDLIYEMIWINFA